MFLSLDNAECQQQIAKFLEGWLPKQRWFQLDSAAKVRVHIVTSIPVHQIEAPGSCELSAIYVVEVSSGDRVELFNVPLVFSLQSGGHDIGHIRISQDFWFVREAIDDPKFLNSILKTLQSQGEIVSSDCALTAHSLGGLCPPPMVSSADFIEVFAGEQSNTSVIIRSEDSKCDSVILKFFRIISDGTNPDVEVGQALTALGSPVVPRTWGWIDFSFPHTPEDQLFSGQILVATELVQQATDVWSLATEAAAENRDFSEQARELGRVTARMHRDLGAAFGVHATAGTEGVRAVGALCDRINWACHHMRHEVEFCAQYVQDAVGRVKNLRQLPNVQRIHGDYHLGQIVQSADGSYRVLDFEGEPLRSIAQRSCQDFALRDLVGMLRSFEYAAAVGRRISGQDTDRWSQAVQDAFVQGWSLVSGQNVDRDGALYRALWLDKALYELVYESQNRPDWVEVPLGALRRFVMHEENVGLMISEDVLAAVAEGRYYDPHQVLGAHPVNDSTVVVRTLRRFAQKVSVLLPDGSLHPLKHEWGGIFSGQIPTENGAIPDYRLSVTWGAQEPMVLDDPYRFAPTLGELDLHLMGEGRHEMLWNALGSHVRQWESAHGPIRGTSFAVWAPHAQAVRVVGDFNGWDGTEHAMRSLGSSGVWEIFIPGVGVGATYKYRLLGQDGQWRDKADPLARWTEQPPRTASRVWESSYEFSDQAWLEKRSGVDPHNCPMSVYEMHIASWRQGKSYRELAPELVEYLTEHGFTHVEFMPVAEHPFGGSWGYQVTGYYAPSSRFGDPDDFKYLVDALHQAGIGVLVDWVPGHFPKDDWALANFDGEPLYEHPDPRRGEHRDWGTLIFDYGRAQVRNFLVANALYWLEEFHIDGLRVDAVASMLYLDYSRGPGQWVPNQYGGRENLEAIEFLQEVNATAYRRNPGIVMIAEESTAFPGVTRPTDAGGLGFGLKWNMGWMHDSLEYVAEDPMYRHYHHGKMTFSLVYAYSENFMLPISHDEVVYGKGSLLRKMPGDRWKQLAGVRAYLAYMWAHPGKQLLFMGQEFAQESEWNNERSLDWWLAESAPHRGVQNLVATLNSVYRSSPALWEQDNTFDGFSWLDSQDAQHNVLSFVRWDRAGNPCVCVVNFSGTPHHGYQLALPHSGVWKEVLNTDASEYGGSGVGNGGKVVGEPQPYCGYPARAVVTLPPLGVLWLQPEEG